MKLAMLLILSNFLFCASVWANQRITSSAIQELSDFVAKKRADLPAEKILLVYDFDNTLMAMDHDLGSDQWYLWQSGLIREGKHQDAVASNMSELFEIHTKIFALGKMHLVEANTADVVKKLQSENIKSIVLTSRGPSLRWDIEEELASVKLSFKNSALGPEGGYPSTVELPGLDRRVSYMDGIMMGAGQNKGQVLRALLKKTGSEFKTIIFMDDTIKNIENMEQEFKEGVELITFYYTHEQERVHRFEKDKSQAKKEWKKLAPVLRSFQGT